MPSAHVMQRLHSPSVMSAAQVKNLQQEISQEVTKNIFNSEFRSIDDLEKLDVLVQEASARYEQLTLEVRTIYFLHFQACLNNCRQFSFLHPSQIWRTY
jgi:hypothetical protein